MPSLNSKEGKRLSDSEWLILACLMGGFVVITFAVFSSRDPTILSESSKNVYVKHYYLVEVKGEVKRPGRYQVLKGSEIRDVSNRAGPLDETQLTRIKPEDKVRKGQVIRLRKKKK